ncbi:MAG: hypothetical protein HZA17_03205 [Nitrospirae bacterium]|nr:hypothetical protein [Nitrospirota bacterium]
MNQQTHACISYIASRLISGKRITFLYDVAESREIDIRHHLDEGFLREFDDKHKDYVPGYASDCTYRYTSSTGYSIEIFINEKTFIVHLCGSAAYFIGNIRGEIIYLYDHKESAHYKYRISGYADERHKHEEISADVAVKQEDKKD